MRAVFSKMTGMVFKVLCFVLIGITAVNGYNLDTKFPIVYQNKPGSYFGFSVALHRNRDGPSALITAPRANSSSLNQLHEPGVLYKCNIERNHNCLEVELDKKGNTLSRNANSQFSYQDKKDGMWLGVSLDVQQNSVRNDIVTCGHKWINMLYDKHYLTNGVCYVINGDLDPNRTTKLVPFVDMSKQAINPPGIYEYAFGQVGTSAVFSEDGKFLLLGAPGYFDWTGTVVSYALNPEKKSQDYTQFAVPSPSVDQNVSPESYIGYSVTSGKFYDDGVDYVAVGAPRDGGFNGRVYIYKAVKSGEKRLNVHNKKEGLQLGEYFGASVLGINLNGDSYTDLLVGAPLYSSDAGVDEGKVYVYLSNGMGLQAYTELYGKSASNARFGTAIANISDLNQDGYDDVAIGAPYEDGSGVVYIYHGSRTGIKAQYVQRISAVEINPLLSGFGIHISRGVDIDSNQYPDLLVGAYASSNALLFRTQPVIQLSAKVTFSPEQINSNVTNCHHQGQDFACVNVTACLLYAGKHVPPHLDFQHEIFVEPISQANLVTPRGFFLHKDKSSTQVSQKSRLNGGSYYCITKELHIHPLIKDVITPVQILYRYSLVASNDLIKGFNKSFPVTDPKSSSNITSSVGFQTGCGTDDKCHSDLSIAVSVLESTNNPLVIGEDSTLSLVIDVINKGEPAYLSKLLIYLPLDMPRINQGICSSVTDEQGLGSNASLLCELGNPLLKDKKVKIQIKLDLTKIPTERKQVSIFFEALTASTEINPADNNITHDLQFTAFADISITGSPSHEQISYDGKTDGKTSVLITHTYFVMNHGPSRVQFIDIVLRVPTSFKRSSDVEFVILRSLKVDSGKQLVQGECNDTYLDIKPILTEFKKNRDGTFGEVDLIDQGDNISKPLLDMDYSAGKFNYSDDKPVFSRSKRSNDRTSSRKKDVVINCETAKCKEIRCSASPFSDIREFVKIAITFEVNLSILNDFSDPWNQIEFETNGKVALRQDKSGVYLKNQPELKTVKTLIVSLAPPAIEEVDQWIIFVSIGVGILLLLIILALLIKFGFFKREQKEKMEEMKSKGDLNPYNPIEGESTESEAVN